MRDKQKVALALGRRDSTDFQTASGRAQSGRSSWRHSKGSEVMLRALLELESSSNWLGFETPMEADPLTELTSR
jgi:hypothetical protein